MHPHISRGGSIFRIMKKDNPSVQEMQATLEKHMRARNYAESTIKSYKANIYKYYKWCGGLINRDEQKIMTYLSHLYKKGIQPKQSISQ